MWAGAFLDLSVLVVPSVTLILDFEVTRTVSGRSDVLCRIQVLWVARPLVARLACIAGRPRCESVRIEGARLAASVSLYVLVALIMLVGWNA